MIEFLKKIKYYILAFLIFETIFITTITNNKIEKEDSYTNNLICNLESQYKAILDKYYLLSKVIFNEHINKSKILNIIDKANNSNIEEKKLLREELLNNLKDYYNYLKKLGFNLVHFHLKGGESFFRFHKSNKFGDKLDRYSLKLINEKKESIVGYEIGKLIDGMRYIFPLFLNNKFIGSVEISLSMDNILKNIKNNFPTDYQFIIKKEFLTQTLFKNELNNYQKSDISNEFFYQKNILNNFFDKKHKNHIEFEIIKKLNLGIKDKLIENLQSKKAFSIIAKAMGEYYIITAIPILDFEKNNVAYILSYQKSPTQKLDNIAFFMTILTITTFVIILLLFIYNIFRKKESLKNAKLNLEKITNNVNDGLIVINKDKKIIFANSSSSFMSHYTKEELLNLQIDNLIIETPMQDKCNYCRYYYSCFIENKKDNALVDEKCLVTKNSTFLPIETTTSNSCIINNEECSIISFKDISERKKFIDELKKQNDALITAKNKALEGVRARDNFIANISHELRTPLNSIINFSDIFIEDYEEVMNDKSIQEEYKSYLERIFKNSKYLLSLINDILEFSKADANKIKYEMFIFNIAPVLENTFNSSKNLLSSDIEFKLNIAKEPLKAKIDEKRFTQIMLNLISNAIKFTEKGFIEIRAFNENDKVIVEIEDSGRGIPKDKRESIFNPFEQVNSFDKGTGLGLGLVKKMSEGMGIDISFKSEENVGTTFKLILKK